MSQFFELIHTDATTRARAGVIRTAHGEILTPVFMPVGTQGSVKTLDQNDLLALDASIILGNTYHLHLRPGEDLIASAGGLHKFMNWPRPILTDSGGFQVFSLGKNKTAQGGLVEIDEEGVTFRSHIDGSERRFTPESATDIQHKIGADIIMAFDECTPDDAPVKYAQEAMERTHRWAGRSLEAHQKNTALHGYPQYMFGIIQGAKNKKLRQASAEYISALDFDGVAIGGESIGYNMEATKEILDWVFSILPENKPHYAMGVGLDPADLLEVVARGVDMFDCVAPTRLARHGLLFVSTKVNAKRRLNITNAAFAADMAPIDPNCSCPVCKNYTRSYLHHLFNAQEITALRLATIHNLHFMLELMRGAREAILADRFEEFKASIL